MFRTDCRNWDGDGDCSKCCKQGYIYSCSEPCEDYEGFRGQKDKIADKKDGEEEWMK